MFKLAYPIKILYFNKLGERCYKSYQGPSVAASKIQDGDLDDMGELLTIIEDGTCTYSSLMSDKKITSSDLFRYFKPKLR